MKTIRINICISSFQPIPSEPFSNCSTYRYAYQLCNVRNTFFELFVVVVGASEQKPCQFKVSTIEKSFCFMKMKKKKYFSLKQFEIFLSDCDNYFHGLNSMNKQKN